MTGTPIRQRQRHRAEAQARLRAPEQPVGRYSSRLELLHELEVHQTELELQNEELLAAQQALEEARDRFEALYHLAPVGYFTLSTRGVIEEVNLTGATLLGMDRHELLGLHLARFVDAPDADRWALLLRTVAKDGERLTFRMTFRRSTGTTLVAGVICEAQGSHGARQVRVVVADLSAQERAEQESRQSQATLATVLADCSDGYWDWFVAEGQVVVGGRLNELVGHPGGQARTRRPFDRRWAERIHPEDLPAYRALLADVVEGRRDRLDAVCRWRSGVDGAWNWIRTRGSVVERDAAGRATRIAGTVTDLTEERRLREAVLRSEARESALAAAVRSFPGGVIGLFDQVHHHLFVDGRGALVTGSEKQTLAGCLLLECFPAVLQERITAAYGAALAGKASRFEARAGERVLEIRTGPVTDPDGQVRTGVVTVLDVTGRARRSPGRGHRRPLGDPVSSPGARSGRTPHGGVA